MSDNRLFPDDPRERLYREALELAAALIAQLFMVLQMPEPPGAAALKSLMRGTLAHAEAIVRRIVWMLAAVLAVRQPETAPLRPAARRAAPPARTGAASARGGPRRRAFRLTERCHAGKPQASPSPQLGRAPAPPRPAPDAARLLTEFADRLQTVIRVLNDPEREAVRLLRQRARLASPARPALAPAIPGFEPRLPEWQRTLTHLSRLALAARQALIDTS
ncbi:MAG: hypothetical protein ACK4P2_00070 [Hyphomonas sp.]